jgi:hypothetical protein
MAAANNAKTAARGRNLEKGRSGYSAARAVRGTGSPLVKGCTTAQPRRSLLPPSDRQLGSLLAKR